MPLRNPLTDPTKTAPQAVPVPKGHQLYGLRHPHGGQGGCNPLFEGPKEPISTAQPNHPFS